MIGLLAAILVAATLAAVAGAAGVSGILYFVLYLLALTPGLPLGFRLFGRRHACGWIAGCALGYLLTSLACWVVIAAQAPSAGMFVLAWAVATAVAWIAARPGQGPIVTLPAWKRRDSVALVLVLLLVPSIAGLPFARLGAADSNGNRYYRAYFTADFVWHMAVTAEMRKFAMPPRNMFMPNQPLHYYWAYYVVPAAVAGTTPGGLSDVESDLKVNAIGTALLFVASIVLAAWCAVPRAAAVGWAVALAIVASSAEGVLALGRIASRGAPLAALRDLNIDAISNWWYRGLRVDGLPRCFWWVPQHSMSYVLGLTALAVAASAGSGASTAAYLVAGLALGGAVVFNPFVGAIFAFAWGLAVAIDALRPGTEAVPRLLRCAVSVIPVLLALGWVTSNHMAGNAPSLVEFGLRGDARMWPVRNLLLSLGPALVPAAAGLFAARRLRTGASVVPAATLACAALLVMHLVRLRVDPSWVGFRGGQIFLSAIPPLVACLLAADGWRRAGAALVTAAFFVGAPTTIVDVYNAQDITNLAPGPGFPWTEVIDRPHMQALDWIRRATPAGAIVQWDPMARGETTWTLISSFGERRMAASLPRTLVKQPEYEERSGRVRQMYATTDAAEAHRIALSLRIDYIWVDAVERAAYPDGVAKFDRAPQLFIQAFRDAEVAVYHVQ